MRKLIVESARKRICGGTSIGGSLPKNKNETSLSIDQYNNVHMSFILS